MISAVVGGGTALGGSGVYGTDMFLYSPSSVAVGLSGNLFVADSGLHTVYEFADGGICTGFEWDTDNWNDLWAIAVDSAENIYIAEPGNNWVRKVDRTTGAITTVAGNGTRGYGGDGGPATAASLDWPQGITIDSAGNLFIADMGNDRIRRVDQATGVITTVAGNGTYGYSGDGGQATAAKLASPQAVAVDSLGNLFIADTYNNRIRRVDHTTGIITTIAGKSTGGYSGDGGPATDAMLFRPSGVIVDFVGNVLIADTDNERIREVDYATGVIMTVAGGGSIGDGSQASLDSHRPPWD